MVGRRLKILVADDHYIVRAGIRAVLEARRRWHVCAEADNGETAVGLAAEHQPNIAILDYSLPILNGLGAIRKIREIAPHTAILIYSMHDADRLIGDVVKAGARGYVLKSEEESELVAGVDALARGTFYFSPRVARSILNPSRGRQPPVFQTLSPRESEVVQLIAEGYSNKAISLLWGVSVKTVDTHRTAAMRKLNVKSAVDLTRYAIRNHLIEP